MSKRSIIRRMAEFKDMYKLVKYVDSDKYDEAILDKKRNDEESIKRLEELYAKQRFLGRWRKPSHAKIYGVMVDASKHKYIKPYEDDKFGHAYDTTTKGRHLIAKKAYFFRVGLWDESLKDYDKAQTVVILIGTAILTAFGGGVIGFILSRI